MGQQSDDEKALTSALYIGLDKVEGKWCNHYAYQQPGLDWSSGYKAAHGRCRAALS